jgi:hypothetical protein
LEEGPKFLVEKGTFHGEKCTFLGERPKFPRETYFKNLFVIIIIIFLFLYVIATYHWKGFEESYNFVSGNASIKIHMQKLQSNKILNTFVPHGNLNFFILGDMIVPKKKRFNLFFGAT